MDDGDWTSHTKQTTATDDPGVFSVLGNGSEKVGEPASLSAANLKKVATPLSKADVHAPQTKEEETQLIDTQSPAPPHRAKRSVSQHRCRLQI